MQVFSIADEGNSALGEFPSQWAMLTSNQNWIRKLRETKWQQTDGTKQFLWTDDYFNITPLKSFF